MRTWAVIQPETGEWKTWTTQDKTLATKATELQAVYVHVEQINNKNIENEAGWTMSTDIKKNIA